jgi:hypothetical protein
MMVFISRNYRLDHDTGMLWQERKTLTNSIYEDLPIFEITLEKK